jgi:MFS family permease
MQLVAPDILADGKGLSVTVSALGLGLGAMVWLLGGVGHRFWLLLVTTLVAGVWGLSIGEAFGVQPLVAALLLAVAAGALALSLVRPAAFLAGGILGCWLAERLITSWNEPFVFFFAGGFLGLFLLRFWLMALTSLAGTLIMAHALFWLLDTLGKVDAPEWAARKPVLLNWACGGAALVGLLLQLGIDRRLRRRARGDDGDLDEEDRSLRARLIRWLGSMDSSRKGRRAA